MLGCYSEIPHIHYQQDDMDRTKWVCSWRLRVQYANLSQIGFSKFIEVLSIQKLESWVEIFKV